MEEWKQVIFVVLAVAMGVSYTVRRYFKQQKYTDFNYKSQKNIQFNKESEEEKRFDFRKKRFEEFNKKNALKAPTSFRTAFSQKTKQAQRVSNVDLNKNFWISLAVLVALFGYILLIY